jgi:hypothetical protein
VVAQLDLESLREPAQLLVTAGARVVEVPTYQTLRVTSSAILRRVGEQIVNRQVDAVALVGLPGTDVVQTVMKRGYRLAC